MEASLAGLTKAFSRSDVSIPVVKQVVESILRRRKQYYGYVPVEYVSEFLGFLMADVALARYSRISYTAFLTQRKPKSWKYQPMYHGRTLWTIRDGENYSVTRIVQIRRKYLERFLADRASYGHCGHSYDCCGCWFPSGTEILYKQGRFAYLRVSDSQNY